MGVNLLKSERSSKKEIKRVKAALKEYKEGKTIPLNKTKKLEQELISENNTKETSKSNLFKTNELKSFLTPFYFVKKRLLSSLFK